MITILITYSHVPQITYTYYIKYILSLKTLPPPLSLSIYIYMCVCVFLLVVLFYGISILFGSFNAKLSHFDEFQTIYFGISTVIFTHS